MAPGRAPRRPGGLASQGLGSEPGYHTTGTRPARGRPGERGYVGILDQLEQGLERVVGVAFARTFRSGLQPVEITAALRRELDTNAAVVARDRILVPNRFLIQLAPGDYTKMTSLGEALTDELARQTHRHAVAQHYSFAGPLAIRFEVDASLAEGVLRITPETVKGEIRWSPLLEIGGVRHPVTKSRTVIGRGHEADVVIDDSGASRTHVEILWDGAKAQITDLGSTNGTRLDGQRITTSLLAPDNVIEIGRTRILFRVLPEAGRA